MGFLGLQKRTWTLFVCLGWICAEGRDVKPQYMVAIPAVIEAGAETKLCASLLQPSENLTMTVTLTSAAANATLLTHMSDKEFHVCSKFKAHLVQNSLECKIKVEVRGDNFYSMRMKNVVLRGFSPLIFVQTDKPIYLPGQTVHFRVITLDSRLRPANQQYDSIQIKDPLNNHIGQWLNESSDYKLLQHSFSLSSEAPEGIYQILVNVDSKINSYTFKVEKYVLSKFDVKVKKPNFVNVAQEEFEIGVCSKYTYQQSVVGIAAVKVCRNFGGQIFNPAEITVPCTEETKKMDKKGCASFPFKMSTFTEQITNMHQNSLTITARVEEEGTGVSISKDHFLPIFYTLGMLSIVDTPNVFEKGSVVEGKVKVVYYNNTPTANMPVYLSVGMWWSMRLLCNLTTDSDGTAAFSFSTDNLADHVTLYSTSTPQPEQFVPKSPHFLMGTHSLSRSRPDSPGMKTVSSLEVKRRDEQLTCDTEHNITVKYMFVEEAPNPTAIMYLVTSGMDIVTQGFRNAVVSEKKVNMGEVSFLLRVTPEMAPTIKIVAYAVLPSETVIANSAEFKTEKCFSHKVSLKFAPGSAIPGDVVNMQVTAQPDSLCGISAVDQSVLLQGKGSILDEHKVFGLLSARKSVFSALVAHDVAECLNVRASRSIGAHYEDDVSKVFLSAKLKMVTNLVITKPQCLRYKGEEFFRTYGGYGFGASIQGGMGLGASAPPEGDGRGGYPVLPPVETVRTFFPETWIWDLIEVRDSGRKDVAVTVPDTITTWETEAFCLSPQGFGLAPRQKLTVFQPFFLELTMPYSIIRGEEFELKATVFNYLTSCLMITVTPKQSSDYILISLPGDQHTSCLCGSERKTLRWTFVASSLGVVNVTVSAEAVASHISCDNEIVSVPQRGRIDVVTRSLIVKAEGTEMAKTYNSLLCPKGKALTKKIEIQLPANVIEGSARASVSVLGDMLGRALKNMDGLLRMPYGCGEQNMALLAPNIYILQYLKNTKQLTSAIQRKAIDFLTSGYQKQLNYKHSNGAYSTFGRGNGNTWLTAFVLRSFAKAQAFIFIDPARIEESKRWLKGKQRTNGCFKQSGKLFHNRMKGGVSDEVTLSAYITAAFLEMGMSVNDPVLNRSLSCLKESLVDLSNTYSTALMAYVFTLAGDMETRDRLLQYLDTIAVREGGFLHWSQSATETSASLAVEISSYVMMAKLSGVPTAEDLGYTSSIVRWLTGQQNYYGGFSSTQDTVVALQALALYSSLVFSHEGSSTVTIQTPSGQLMFNVNQENKLLYQEAKLQDMAGNYSLEVQGTECASVQISLHYNIPTPTNVTTLSVEANATADCSSQSPRPRLILELRLLYNGQEETTNMVILDIKVLSGFALDTESLLMLRGAGLVDRVDQKDDRVLVYLRELFRDRPVTYSLRFIQELPVQNLKPAVVKIYDYYQPSDQAETEYNYTCEADFFQSAASIFTAAEAQVLQ